jgi:hypothetical protein
VVDAEERIAHARDGSRVFRVWGEKFGVENQQHSLLGFVRWVFGESRWVLEVIWDVGRTIVKGDWIPEEIGVEVWDGEGKRMKLVRGEKI